MEKVFGFKKSNFTTKDGNYVEGFNFYVGKEITRNGEGYEIERVYLSNNKLKNWGIAPEQLIGASVEVLYNRYGKVERIDIIDEE